MIAKLDWTQSNAQNVKQLQDPTMRQHQQRINYNRTTAFERTAAKAYGGIKEFYWYQIFALDSAVVEAQEMFSSHGGFLTIVMYHHRETIKITHYNETEKKAHDLQIVRAKENLQLSHGGPSLGQASGTNPLIKALRQSHIESKA